MRHINDFRAGEVPTIGEVYLVPCMDLRNLNKYTTPDRFKPYLHLMNAIPVMGQTHADTDFRGAGGEYDHLHVDLRFMTEFECDTIWNIPLWDAMSTFGRLPILPNHSGIVLPDTYLHPKMYLRHFGDYRERHIGIDDDYQHFEDKMESRSINLEKPICPHHGTPLNGQPIVDDVITCPAHALNWCAKTGVLKRKTKKCTKI